MSPVERRERLVEWFRFPGRGPVSRADIVAKSGLYVERHITDNLQNQCQRDLKRLEKEGLVRGHRFGGGAARWEVVR